MKLIWLILVLLLHSSFSFAQQTDRKIIIEVDSCNINNIHILIEFYRKKNNKSELKKVLEKSVECPLRIFRQLDFYLQLADIYYEEGEYNKSLRLIDLYDRVKYTVKLPHNPYQQTGNFAFAQKRSKCYEGLHFIDSAIEVLSTFVFFEANYFQPFYDSASYESICNYFVSLLRYRYSTIQIKAEFNKADSSFYYSDLINIEEDKFGFTHHKINCGFYFLNYQIKYFETEILNNKGEVLANYLSRAYQYKYFRESTLFKMLKRL